MSVAGDFTFSENDTAFGVEFLRVLRDRRSLDPDVSLSVLVGHFISYEVSLL
jgi:hypothetical protein